MAMCLGCAIPVGLWANQYWLIQIFLSFTITGNFYIAYKLRDMQNIGTSWIFVIVYLGMTLIWTMLNVIGAAKWTGDCNNHVLLAVGYVGFALMQMVTTIMLCTVRQNSLENYKKLPIWIVTFGSLFNLCAFILLVYQSIYLKHSEDDDSEVSRRWRRFIKSMYIVGLIGPILTFIFNFFLISRLNKKTLHD